MPSFPAPKPKQQKPAQHQPSGPVRSDNWWWAPINAVERFSLGATPVSPAEPVEQPKRFSGNRKLAVAEQLEIPELTEFGSIQKRYADKFCPDAAEFLSDARSKVYDDDYGPLTKTAAETQPRRYRPRSEVVIFNEKGVLCRDMGTYILFPGGGIDDGETPLMAAQREASEEAARKILNVEARDVAEAIWPEKHPMYGSGYDGERTYFFVALDGGVTGGSHPDQESFQFISFDRIRKRLTTLIAQAGEAWARRNNRVRRRLVWEAKRLSSLRHLLRGRKMAGVIYDPQERFHTYQRLRSRLLRAQMLGETGDTAEVLEAAQTLVRSLGGTSHVLDLPDGEQFVERMRELATEYYQGEYDRMGQLCPVREAGSIRAVLPVEPCTGRGVVFFDLDETLRVGKTQPGWVEAPDDQELLPGRLEKLQGLARAGMTCVGVTNASPATTAENDQEDFIKIQKATIDLTQGALKNIIFCADRHDERHKPNPDMLEFACWAYRVSPDDCLMVGNDLVADQGAAEAAGIPFMHCDEYFPCMSKQADAPRLMEQDEYVLFDDADNVFVDPKQLSFPSYGLGRPAPYEQPVRIIPDDGVPEPGFHGRRVKLHVGSATAAPEGYAKLPADELLKKLYGAMGRKESRQFMALLQARARVVRRERERRKKLLEQRRLPSPQELLGG